MTLGSFTIIDEKINGYDRKKKEKEYSRVKTKNSLLPEEQMLFKLLAAALQEETDEQFFSHTDTDFKPHMQRILFMAKKHKILSLLYPILEMYPEFDAIKKEVQGETEKVVFQSLRLLFLDKYLCEGFEKAGISVAVLKGMATACFYKSPELRKSGDVDLLLLNPVRQKDAQRCMEEMGFVQSKEQHALHHIVYHTKEGVEVELHTSLAEPFDNEKTNHYLEMLQRECEKQLVQKEFLGVRIVQLKKAFHAYELLLHMLQHFLRSGFGLKLLCDWVVLWNQETDSQEKEEYLRLVRESGLKGFSDMITGVCCRYLGLNREKVSFMGQETVSLDQENMEIAFIREILEAEEFGKTSKDRMVALRGNSIFDYIREFHHQMHLNYPRAGKLFLLWPILWVSTLIRFLVNNHKIRRVSFQDVIKKAGQRGKLMEKLELFKSE